MKIFRLFILIILIFFSCMSVRHKDYEYIDSSKFDKVLNKKIDYVLISIDNIEYRENVRKNNFNFQELEESHKKQIYKMLDDNYGKEIRNQVSKCNCVENFEIAYAWDKDYESKVKNSRYTIKYIQEYKYSPVMFATNIIFHIFTGFLIPTWNNFKFKYDTEIYIKGKLVEEKQFERDVTSYRFLLLFPFAFKNEFKEPLEENLQEGIFEDRLKQLYIKLNEK